MCVRHAKQMGSRALYLQPVGQVDETVFRETECQEARGDFQDSLYIKESSPFLFLSFQGVSPSVSWIITKRPGCSGIAV